MSDNTLGYGSWWGATNVYCGVNYDGNVGRGGGSGVSTAGGTGMSWLRSVAVCLV